ncbi:alcohol dehydrogenase catalytic domain-containing protein [Oceanobacillus sp. FSL K6-2867]|uniref:zinc-dependent alcohol dehydrogenase n=1 Tax=Oceanobacillus sp. FSL K6-2867 TaxID=2954748 RepID=UPI0030DB4A90
MLAAVKTSETMHLNVAEVPTPELSSGEVLLKVEYCGVCGSDLHAYKNSKGYEFVKAPRILGHEVVGIVVETFEKENEHLIQRRVVAEAINFCGECENCQNNRSNICENFKVLGLHMDGGMAQFVRCKANLLQPVVEEVPSELAALTEPVSVAVHAVEVITHVKKGDHVWIQGAGIIGFLVGLICKHNGAKVTIAGLPQDKENRLVHAESFEFDTYVETESAPVERKVDVFFECSGSQKGVEAGIQRVKKGGKFVFVALYEKDINLPLNILVRNEVNLLTTYSCKSDEYGRSLELIKQYKNEISKIIRIYPLNQASQAFLDALSQKTLKPILQLA